MVNHKPVAGDYTFLTGFYPDGSFSDRFDDPNILTTTAIRDVDGDPVHLAFINGQRMVAHDGDWMQIEGKYGVLSIMDDGRFRYAWDESNPAVQAMEANGGKLVDRFDFKISDGRGGTDFGYLNIATEALTPGTSTVTFEDATRPDFPDIYKGLSWGMAEVGQGLNLNTSGNHFVYTTPNDGFSEFSTANLSQYVTYEGVDIKTSSVGPLQYGADITFDGRDAEGNLHELTVSIDAGNGNFDMSGAEHVSLAGLGAVNELNISYSFPGEDPNAHDNSVLLFDNFTINV